MGKIIHQADVMQLNILDDRFYTNDGENFYPSVTTILEVMPEGFGLEVWKKDLGHNADIVLKRAGEEGTHVHDAIQDYLQGHEVRWVDDNGKGFNYSEWTSISRFIEFWDMVKGKAKVIAVEMKVLSVNLRLGGAIDLVVDIGGVRWIIDYKTSNYLHDSFDLQISAYANIWNEQYPDYPIHKCGILHLKAQTRGADKSGKCSQGKGWKLYELEKDYNQEFQFFQTLRVVWDRANPDYKPKNLKMPDRFRIDTVPVPIIRNNEPETPVLGGALHAIDMGKPDGTEDKMTTADEYKAWEDEQEQRMFGDNMPEAQKTPNIFERKLAQQAKSDGMADPFAPPAIAPADTTNVSLPGVPDPTAPRKIKL